MGTKASLACTRRTTMSTGALTDQKNFWKKTLQRQLWLLYFQLSAGTAPRLCPTRCSELNLATDKSNCNNSANTSAKPVRNGETCFKCDKSLQPGL